MDQKRTKRQKRANEAMRPSWVIAVIVPESVTAGGSDPWRNWVGR